VNSANYTKSTRISNKLNDISRKITGIDIDGVNIIGSNYFYKNSLGYVGGFQRRFDPIYYSTVGSSLVTQYPFFPYNTTSTNVGYIADTADCANTLVTSLSDKILLKTNGSTLGGNPIVDSDLILSALVNVDVANSSSFTLQITFGGVSYYRNVGTGSIPLSSEGPNSNIFPYIHYMRFPSIVSGRDTIYFFIPKETSLNVSGATTNNNPYQITTTAAGSNMYNLKLHPIMVETLGV
jgi:hypothetical protein